MDWSSTFDFLIEEKTTNINEDAKLQQHFDNLRPTLKIQHGMILYGHHMIVPYYGNYVILELHPKPILDGTKSKTVFINRLKPAYLPMELEELDRGQYKPRKVKFLNQGFLQLHQWNPMGSKFPK